MDVVPKNQFNKKNQEQQNNNNKI